MPFGLTNNLATFMDIMKRGFRPFLDMVEVLLINDILVYSKIVKDHESHLRMVLGKLKEVKFLG